MSTRRSTTAASTPGTGPATAAAQLELPLVGAAPAPAPATERSRRRRTGRSVGAGRGTGGQAAAPGAHHPPARRPDLGDGSRLDEQTRRIGLQGIAAARALLAAAEVDADRTRAGGDRGATGCAA